MKELQTIKRLLPFFNYYPWALPMIIALGILSSLSEGLGISLFIPLLQSLQSDAQTVGSNAVVDFFNQLFSDLPPEKRVFIIASCIFLSIVVKSCLTYSTTLVFSWFNSRVCHRLRYDIFDQLLSVSYSFLETKESGKLLNSLATETWQTSRALETVTILVINLCTTLIFTSLLLLLSWKLTLVVGAAMLLISLLIRFVTRTVKQIGREAVETNRQLSDRIWESFGGMWLIRSFGREPYELQRFDQASKQVRDVFFKLDRLSRVVNPLSEILSAVLLLGVLSVVLWQHQTALPSLLTFLFVLHRLQPRIKQLDGARVSLMGFSSSVEDVVALLDRTDKPYIRSGTIPFDQLHTSISLESVNFHYSTADGAALEDVSICIPKGKTTALVGPSGAGKSTLIKLLLRFYDPTEGTITVDGHDLRDLNLDDWRSRFALVSQDIYLFSTTIRDNIAYGRLDATEDEIVEAAKLANAHDFICQFPYGYDTKVGDRGVRLSGGQRQRIALARAIIRNPQILILDEATNALDSISETLIQEALSALSRDRTVVVIAHRLSTIEQADQIIVLEHGKVVEQGNLQHLLSLNGLFAKLYALQNHVTPS